MPAQRDAHMHRADCVLFISRTAACCVQEDSPNDISRGAFAAEVGLPRLLKLFKKHGITTTFFIPGCGRRAAVMEHRLTCAISHTLESFPKECEAIRDAGHEIGLHGCELGERRCPRAYA